MPPLMDLREFQDAGYLSEVNRQVLHPLGLALAVMHDDDGEVTGWGVYDDREDPEGWYFGDNAIGAVAGKAANIQSEWEARREARVAALGWMVQPVDGEPAFHA